MAVNKRTLGAAVAPAPVAADKRDPSEFWVNVGYTHAAGTEDEVFVSLPFGATLDNQDQKYARSRNALMQAKHSLAVALLEVAKDLAPGEEIVLTDLQVQIRRAADESEATAENNSIVASMPQLRSAA